MAISSASFTAILATPTDKCVFVGKIETLPLQADPLNTGSTYIAKGPTFDLQRCDYSQSWYYRNALGELAQDFDPNVCLCDNNGNRITTGQQIAAVVNYAATRGLNVATGTIAPGMFAPYDQKIKHHLLGRCHSHAPLHARSRCLVGLR